MVPWSVSSFHSSRCTFCDGVSEWSQYEAPYLPSGVGYKCQCGQSHIPLEYLQRYQDWYMDVEETRP